MFRAFLTAGICSIFALVAVFGVRSRIWPFVEDINQRDQDFGDLNVLLHLADFFQRNPLGDPNQVGLSEFGITPNYPLILPRILGSFSIGLDDLLLVGTFLIALMAIAVSMIFFFATSGKPFPVVVITAVFAVLWSFSPPFMLAAERGNYDILIFVILTIAALVFHRFGWISAGLVLVSALFKLFPIAAAIGFLRLKRGWALLLVPICGLAFYLL